MLPCEIKSLTEGTPFVTPRDTYVIFGDMKVIDVKNYAFSPSCDYDSISSFSATTDPAVDQPAALYTFSMINPSNLQIDSELQEHAGLYAVTTVLELQDYHYGSWIETRTFAIEVADPCVWSNLIPTITEDVQLYAFIGKESRQFEYDDYKDS